jgi:hypothetical protein
MITISLKQHERAFDALMAGPHVAERAKHLVRSARGEAYMIVGVKVVFDRRVMLVTDPTTGTSTTVPVPANEDVWDAVERLSSPVRLVILDSSGTHWLRDGRRVDVSHRFEGAKIFALEYRSVTFAKSRIREPSISPDSLSDLPINNNIRDLTTWRRLLTKRRSSKSVETASRCQDICTVCTRARHGT